MPLLTINLDKKVTATVTLSDAVAQQVDQYAAMIKAPADEVVNAALELLFSRDKDFVQYRSTNGNAAPPKALRVKRTEQHQNGNGNGNKTVQ